jgi:1-acyl-sn-glycerol-3-phosphate acyltransferase
MDQIPKDNKYVVIFNHVSLVEVPFIAAFWPEILEIIGAAAVWDRSGQNLIAKMWSGIQLKRYEFDREVFRQINSVLKAGRPLMIAPEGGRSHQPGLRRGKPGVAYIVDQADLPVIPVGVVGNTMDFLTQGLRGKRPPLQMFVGEPFRVLPIQGRGEERRNMRQQNTDYMMSKLAAMLPESYRGVYSQYKKILAGEEVSFEIT